ncbi:YfiR family protein [uncultured Psychromonas sp.]|uniref:YfiR family protein n=1 Tax=uncultured Psychromonas sp. TaxID=173974 RepID=UPI00261B9678|nr:YfiR family protein [uncultured Psychromonas sp.]
MRKLFIAKLLLVMFFISQEAVATPREDAIKSGFLYNFARYSDGDWFNPDIKSTYNICSFNPEFITAAKNTLKDLTIKKRPIKVYLLTSFQGDIVDCDTLFLSKGDSEKWVTSDNKAFSNVMLVGEFDGFLASGGHINFFIVGGKVRFEIDPIKLKNSGINMSSKVLRLGRIHERIF